MATAAIFSSLRRRRSPSLEVLLPPVDLNDVALVQTLASVAADLVSCFIQKSFFFQRKNSRSLIRKVDVFLVFLQYLKDLGTSLPAPAVICFKELYLLLYRSKILLDYCSQSCKLWLLLQNHSLSVHFHDLNLEILTILDVFPFGEVKLDIDIREQLKLLQNQLRRGKLYIEQRDEGLRIQFLSFLHDFENGKIPDSGKLKEFFVKNLEIKTANSCRAEIEHLEEQILNHNGDIEPTISVLGGFVALTRYGRFLIFGFDGEELESSDRNQKMKNKSIKVETAETFVTIPKDFCCSISLELMTDPVIIATGQTYDRCSIARWIEEGHCNCPKTGQMLVHNNLVPNRALRNLIMQWCSTHGVAYDPPEEGMDSSAEKLAAASSYRAAVEANRATTQLLIQQLANGSQEGKTIAVREIRLLAKAGKENRAFIAEAGAMPYLLNLLSSPNHVAQENSITAMLNLSIYDKNKSRIMEEEGCLRSIVRVLKLGKTTEARENAAATLFSLSSVHNYKKRIADEEGALEGLAGLIKEGTSRGKKDAVTALFNLSTHVENGEKLISTGAVKALVGALTNDGVAEQAAGALALIVRQPVGAQAVGDEEVSVSGLISMMRGGTPRGKENAVAALLEICRAGGVAATERVGRAPALASLLQTLSCTGTKRARRKAASLTRLFQRCENITLHYSELGVGYAFSSNSATGRESSFIGDMSISSIPISVRVL